ncbi:DUF1344 domain-containing protein [Pseudaminobacter sp. 19-2017]|uniref:DUF1344 domain-containing protein n=1 Tax=Pseudaminobacter soli (ex Zhang et al. 2022) TaxID=2831468 RepID=A0A942DXI2_9HYPH|nr:DUF1344 domain-containing protein [Pseudaminobacter soli]MBS3647126.1 DUF1344 domain-containing protein [Pseudaminobacter soli]
MKRIIISTIAATALFGAGAAFAAEATGSIKSIDAKNHHIMLDNGQTYTFPSKTNLSQLKVGEKVKINYQNKGGRHEASAVAPAM